MSEPSGSRLSADDRPAHLGACCWPRCGNPTARGNPFCSGHWYSLPPGHRDAVRAALEWVRIEAAAK